MNFTLSCLSRAYPFSKIACSQQKAASSPKGKSWPPTYGLRVVLPAGLWGQPIGRDYSTINALAPIPRRCLGFVAQPAKAFFTSTANRAMPIIRQIFKLGSRRNLVALVTAIGVIYVTTVHHLATPHVMRISHGASLVSNY